MKIRKNDNVIVLAGKDRNKTGKVEKVFPAESRVVVTGVNVYKKSVKPTRRAPKGGIIEINAKLDASNVGIVCPSCSKVTRIGYSINKDKKIRVCKKCQANLDVTN